MGDAVGARTTAPRWLRPVLRAPDLLYRLGAGRLLGRRFLRLVHVGRRTGRRHATVLEVVHHDPDRDEFVVVSGFGERADWLRNVEAGGAAEVTVGRHNFVAAHRRLSDAEAVAVLGAYEQRAWLVGPLVRHVLSRLVGWRYDGAPDARRRLAAQLPLVAFRPREVPRAG